MTEADLERVLPLEHEIFTDAWSLSFFGEVLAEPGSHALVAEAQDQLAGYATFLVDPPGAHLTNLAVAPAYRRKSVAHALLDRILGTVAAARCEHISLEVRPGNAGAIAFYRKHGFEIAYRWKNYYRDPVEDALVMLRFLGTEGQEA